MASKTLVLITGANQGLGYYAAQQMAATGKYHVLVGSRDITKAETAIKALGEETSPKVDVNDLEPLLIDVNSDESIKKAVQTVQEKHGKLDVLMNNAGIAIAQEPAADGSGPSRRELWHQHFDTNLFSAAEVTEQFIPLLRESTAPDGKRIAFTSSGLSSLEWALENEGNYSGEFYPLYRSTKTALNMLMVHYARKLERDGFVVTGSDPGYCGTNLNGYHGMKDPRDGAKVLVRAAVDEKTKVHGRVIDEKGPEPW